MAQGQRRQHGFVCYLLFSPTTQRVYTGITNCLSRRMRQHNGALAGGSRYTSRHRPWKLVCYITGFCSHREVLRYEWRCKRARCPYTRNPLARAMGRFNVTCRSEAWWVSPRTSCRSLLAHFLYEGPEHSVLQGFNDTCTHTQRGHPGLSVLPIDVLLCILQEYLVHGAYYARVCGLKNTHQFACCSQNTICALCHT
jgi:predicted GIY-YIG superfamily endonuclease